MTWAMASMATDGSLWAIDSSSTAQLHLGDGQYLADNSVAMAQLSVASGTQAWGLDTSGRALALAPAPLQLVGANIGSVAVGRDGTVWRASGYPASISRRNADGTWQSMPLINSSPRGPQSGALAVGDANTVWAISGDYYQSPAWRFDGAQWVNTTSGMNGFAFLSIGRDNSVWGYCPGDASMSGKLYRYVADGNWSVLPGPGFIQMAAVREGADIWISDGYGNLSHWDGGRWTPQPGRLSALWSAADGTLYGSLAGPPMQPGTNFRYNGFYNWTQLSLPLDVLWTFQESGLHNAWLVNLDESSGGDNLYTWAGFTWQPMGATLASISGAADGTVWGVDASNKIFRYNGSGWDAMPGAATRIAVGSAAQVWSIAPGGGVQSFVAGAWQAAPSLGQAALSLSVGSDGVAFAVGADHYLYQLHNNAWVKRASAGKLLQVSGGDSYHLAGATLSNHGTPPINYVWLGGFPP
ncbi:MAG TPA: tectonin domain-containing protein [Polyangia bacterium]|nr:tectonin domain-containing protein [Polyangia bacterium]